MPGYSIEKVLDIARVEVYNAKSALLGTPHLFIALTQLNSDTKPHPIVGARCTFRGMQLYSDQLTQFQKRAGQALSVSRSAASRTSWRPRDATLPR